MNGFAMGLGMAIILGGLLVVESVEAFRSWPRAAGELWKQSEHVQITEAAARAMGFDEKSAEALEDAAIGPDIREFFETEPYDASHHFDRKPPMTSAEAFRRAASYMREQRDLAVRLASKGDTDKVRLALGRSLHALQDFYSHSNFVALSPQDQGKCVTALWSEGRSVPPSLTMTSFDPAARDPQNPPNDPEHYTHGEGAKDKPDKNAEASYAHELSAKERIQLLERQQELFRKLAGASSEYQREEIKSEMKRITDELEPKLKAGASGAGEAGDKGSTDFARAKRAAEEASATLLRQIKAAVPGSAWLKLSKSEAPAR